MGKQDNSESAVSISTLIEEVDDVRLKKELTTVFKKCLERKGFATREESAQEWWIYRTLGLVLSLSEGEMKRLTYSKNDVEQDNRMSAQWTGTELVPTIQKKAEEAMHDAFVLKEVLRENLSPAEYEHFMDLWDAKRSIG